MKIYRLETAVYEPGDYADEWGDYVDGDSEYFLKEEDAISKFNEIFAENKEYYEKLEHTTMYKIKRSKENQGHDYAELENEDFITVISISEINVK